LGLAAAVSAHADPGAADAMAAERADRIERIERRLRTAPKLGMRERRALRVELADLRAGIIAVDDRGARDEDVTLLARLRTHREGLAVNPLGVRRHGAGEHGRIRAEQTETDALIAVLEAGDRTDPVRVAAVLGARASGVGRDAPTLLATRGALQRELLTGRGLGALERRRVRAALEAIDARIASLDEVGNDEEVAAN
jgi:hypothetical protein